MKNFLVVCHFSKNKYSGGRFVAWNLISALVENDENKVEVWTNNIPVYFNEYKPYLKNINKLKFDTSVNYKLYKKKSYDFVIIIPDRSPSPIIRKALFSSILSNSKLVLYNFETPNWVNKYVKKKVNPSLWKEWLYVSAHTDAIISISEESKKHAINYYEKNHQFVWVPPINSFVADRIKMLKESAKKNEIIFITRFNSHKQNELFFKLFNADLSNYTFKFIIGNGGVPKNTLNKINVLSSKFNISIKILKKVPEVEKFRELSKSKCLIFFSEFEGLGLPPYEALYVGTKCICLELEVLKEISNNIIFTNSDKILDDIKTIKHENVISDKNVENTFKFKNSATRLNRIINEIYLIKKSKKKSNNIILFFSIIVMSLRHLIYMILYKINIKI